MFNETALSDVSTTQAHNDVHLTIHAVVWRYAAGCIGNQLHGMSSMTEADVHLAMELAKRGTMPTAEQIKQWFPKPFRALKEHDLPESAEGMKSYWQKYHNERDRRTPVYLATVRALSHDVKVSVGYKRNGTLCAEDVFNIHRLGVAVGDTVYVHAGCICEVV